MRNIEKLIKQIGTKKETAWALGITGRHLNGILLKPTAAGRSLNKLISCLLRMKAITK